MNTRTRRQANPGRTEVRGSDNKWVATMTDDAYTVTLSEPV